MKRDVENAADARMPGDKAEDSLVRPKGNALTRAAKKKRGAPPVNALQAAARRASKAV